jgi:hypothetical protein
MKSFLSAGDVLINPALLAYAIIENDSEGPNVRLGFAGSVAERTREIELTGLEARSVIRWLRTNADFLDAGKPAIPRDRTPSSGRPKDKYPGWDHAPEFAVADRLGA